MGRNEPSEPVPLRQVVGERVRALRESAGARQDDVSAAAQRHGLAWPRSKVAALERGEKSLSAEELLVLPSILTMALDRHDSPVSYVELFDSDAPVRLGRAGTRSSWAAARDIPEILRGDDKIMTATAKPSAQAAWVAGQGLAAQARIRDLDLGRIRASMLSAVESEQTEADAKAARATGESTAVLAFVAAHLWGRSLSAERDRRAALTIPGDAPPRTVQAKRGRITRDLIAEAKTYITDREARR